MSFTVFNMPFPVIVIVKHGSTRYNVFIQNENDQEDKTQMLINCYYYAPHNHELLNRHLEWDLKKMKEIGCDARLGLCPGESVNQLASGGVCTTW